jgi:hypothetical protein
MGEIENTIGWGEGSVNNTIGWGQAQEAWCEITPSSPATVKNSDESYNTTVAAGGTLSLPDITVTDSDGSTFTAPSVQDIFCTPAAAPVGATLMKTGQTTSYRTGCDGDLEAGRATSFTVLASNNPFGNTNRFTDTLGGQTYTNNIVIDWSTYNGTNVLGWYKSDFSTLVLETWNAAIDNSLLLNVAGYTGWKIPNMIELISIMNISNTNVFNYAPFNNTTLTVVWTSTTAPSSTSSAIIRSGDTITTRGKTSTSYSTRCRTFTVTGTTLT